MHTHFVRIHTPYTRDVSDEAYDFLTEEDFIFETPAESEAHLDLYDGTLDDTIRTSYTRIEFL